MAYDEVSIHDALFNINGDHDSSTTNLLTDWFNSWSCSELDTRGSDQETHGQVAPVQGLISTKRCLTVTPSLCRVKTRRVRSKGTATALADISKRAARPNILLQGLYMHGIRKRANGEKTSIPEFLPTQWHYVPTESTPPSEPTNSSDSGDRSLYLSCKVQGKRVLIHPSFGSVDISTAALWDCGCSVCQQPCLRSSGADARCKKYMNVKQTILWHPPVTLRGWYLEWWTSSLRPTYSSKSAVSWRDSSDPYQVYQQMRGESDMPAW